MQTLNVDAGRTEAEHQAAQEQRRADLVAESRNAANLFFWAAGLAALGTGLLPVRLNFLVSIGCIDLTAFYGRSPGPLYPIVLYSFAVTWVAVLLGLAFAARAGFRWAFIAGIAIYAVDAVALLVTISILSFAVHGIFIFMWFQGQKLLREVRESGQRAT